MPVAKQFSAVIALGLLTLAAGCHPDASRAPVGYYLDAGALASSVRSVVFIPLKNETRYPSLAEGMTSALFQAVQARQLFHLQVLPPADPATGEPLLDGRRDFTLNDLSRLRQTLGCDAVLVGAASEFQQYPRMRIGLYLRLVDLRDSRVLWAVDHVWDTTDQATQKRIEHYFSQQKGQGFEPLEWRLTTISPGFFQQFVAFETAQTLPQKPAED